MVTLKKRKTNANEIRKFNLVITSYTTFMTEWKSGSSPLQVCPLFSFVFFFLTSFMYIIIFIVQSLISVLGNLVGESYFG